MPRTKEAAFYVARSSGIVKIDGTLYRYFQGRTMFPAGHPVIAALPDRFTPLDTRARITVEGAEWRA